MRHSPSHIIAFLLILILGVIGCKSSKETTATDKPVKRKNLLAYSSANDLDFQSLILTGKARADVDAQDVNVGLNYRIHIQRDSLIWIRVTKLGIEAFRVLMKPDSIFILDKINQQYDVAEFSEVERFTGMPTDFEMLQDILVGNTHLFPENLTPVKASSPGKSFSGTAHDADFTYVIDPSSARLLSLATKNETRNQEALITYSSFEPQANVQFGMQMDVEARSPNLVKLEFKHRRVEVDPDRISFGFVVPDHYERSKR